jgi:hypothetical protein
MSGEMPVPIGEPIEPDVRATTGTLGGNGDQRRFDCLVCEDEVNEEGPDSLGGSKLVAMSKAIDPDRGHITDITTWCEQCKAKQRHEPAGACPLAYHRWREAMRRRAGR